MSMVALAIRIAATRALEEAATLAAGRVFDSAILPIGELVSKDPQPFIIVSTETETTKPKGRNLNTGDGEVELVIELALARVVPLPARAENNEEFQVEIFEADASFEICLAILRRQIAAALFERGGGRWGDVFRRFVPGISNALSVRTSQSKGGTRFAGRQVILTLQAMGEPAYGPPLEGSPWAEFLDALAADPKLATIEPIIRSAIVNAPLNWPETYTASAVLAGYTEAEARLLGLAPLVDLIDESDTDELREGVFDPDGWIANAETVAEQLPEPPA